MWCRWEVSELKPFEEKKVREWSTRWEKNSELFAARRNGVAIVSMARFKEISGGREYSLLYAFQYLASEG